MIINSMTASIALIDKCAILASKIIINTQASSFIYDTSKPIILKSALLEVTYGLSKAELKVASLLVNGYALESVAQTLEVSSNTVKTHLKHIHDKTNTNNRA